MHLATDTVALHLNVNTDRPLQAQLFEQVRALILDGQLKAGAALPATRALSEQLGVSRNTVILAYDRLLNEGYIESKRSIGTFVTEAIADRDLSPAEIGLAGETETEVEVEGTEKSEKAACLIAKRHHDFFNQDTDGLFPRFEDHDNGERSRRNRQIDIDFRCGTVDPTLHPERTWRRIYHRQCANVESYLNEQHSPLGLYELRRAITDHLGPARGLIATPEEVVIVGSVQQGRALLAHLLLAPPEGAEKTGRPKPLMQSQAIMEAPGPRGVAQLYHQAGAYCHEIAVDEDGLRTDLLPKLSQEQTAGQGMVYVTPSQHYSLGMNMPLARRVQLLEWAKTACLMVVEDETDSDFRYGGAPLSALKGLDREGSVVYLGSFERVMGRGLGLAYVILPPDLVMAAGLIKQTHCPGPMLLEQATMAEFLDSGAYDRHLRKLKKKAHEKRDLLIGLLHKHFGDVQLIGTEGGLQLSWRLPASMGRADQVAHKALSEAGLGVYTVSSGGSFLRYMDDEMARILTLGFGGLAMEDITEGIERLARLYPLPRQTKFEKTSANGASRMVSLNANLGVTR